jgi:hypothetical protein
MFAYLDPGSGSMIAGVLAAGGAGVGVAARSLLGKFRMKGRSGSAPQESREDEHAEADDQHA